MWAVQKRLNRSTCRLRYGLGWDQERGAHWRHLANIIDPSMCGSDAAFSSNYFWPLVNLLLLGYVVDRVDASVELFVRATGQRRVRDDPGTVTWSVRLDRTHRTNAVRADRTNVSTWRQLLRLHRNEQPTTTQRRGLVNILPPLYYLSRHFD